MTTHPRTGDKKRTLSKAELDALREALQADIRGGGCGTKELDLLTDLINAKRVVIITRRLS